MNYQKIITDLEHHARESAEFLASYPDPDEMESEKAAHRAMVCAVHALRELTQERAAHDAMHETRSPAGQSPALAVDAGFGGFGVWVPTADRVPANPEGFPRNDHVPCLCAWLGENVGGDMRILQWNAYYKVWDDAYGDDFFCNAQEVTHWMPLPPWPNIANEPRRYEHQKS